MQALWEALHGGKVNPLQVGLDAAHKRVGELSMENELLRARIGRLETGTPFPRARSRR
jgi:transposase